MDPLTIGVGIMAVGGLAQLYTSEQARGASQKRLNDIERMFNAVKPPNYDLSINAPPQLHMETLRLPQFSDPMNNPKFDLSALKQEDLKMIGQYQPQLAKYIQEVAPTTLEKTADMKLGREAQLNALRKMQEIGSSSFDPQYQEAVQKAARSAQGEAQSRQASIMQDFARRGIAGSGMNLAAQMGSAAQSMDRAASINQSAATDAYKNRLNALMSGASLGSQIGQEDTQFQGRNADIINDFNRRVAANRQNYENQNTGTLNSAQQYNLGVGQRISDANILNRNAMAQEQRAREDALAKYQAAFSQGERTRQDQNSMWNYGQQDAANRYKNSLIGSQAAWQAAEKDKYNSLLGKEYQDKMDIIRGKAGISSSRNDADISAARDRNAAIQGLSNTALMYGMGQQQRQDQQAASNLKFDRDKELIKMQQAQPNYGYLDSSNKYYTSERYA